MCFNRRLALCVALIAATALSGCMAGNPRLTPAIAEPNTRPMRNFTSFADSLRCMDDLFAKLPKRTFLVSSSDIPDETEDLDVGGDDMLINAINQMNRKSGRYIFLDQARISAFGQLELVTTRKDDEVKPHMYIRGSISQIDQDTAERDISPSWTKTLLQSSRSGSRYGGLSAGFYNNSKTLSIVTVDMHLVRYPSRQVIAGGSVANSMVVIERGNGAGITGVIDNGRWTVPISVERIESQGQAARNLIELGAIELLGKHAGVPYWTCLETRRTDSIRNEKDERGFDGKRKGPGIRETQDMLIALGHMSGPATGRLDRKTRRAISRYQSRQDLLVNGIVDYDLYRRLKQEMEDSATAGIPPEPVPAKPKSSGPKWSLFRKQSTTSVSQNPSAVLPTPPDACRDNEPCEDAYRNLYDFLKEEVE